MYLTCSHGEAFFKQLMQRGHQNAEKLALDFGVLVIELDLVCSRGSCGVTYKIKIFACEKIDCSQSPYFSVQLSRLVRFAGAVKILVCKSVRDLGSV